MLQRAGYTVCRKRNPFNRPLSISLFCLSLRGCLVKTRTRLPIVSAARSWGYPSLSSCPHCRIGWHPTASSPLWLVPTTTWLVSITTSSPFGLRPRCITACLGEDGIALFLSSFGVCQHSGFGPCGHAPPQVSLYASLATLVLIVRQRFWWSSLCLIFLRFLLFG